MIFKHRRIGIAATVSTMTLASVSLACAVEQTTTAPATPVTVVAHADEAAAVWSWLKDSNDQSQLERFIRRYPDSRDAVNARVRLEMLKQAGSPAATSVVHVRKPAPANAPLLRSSSSAEAARTNILLASRQPECWGFWCGRHFPILLGIGY
jgi:hypothetical protein